MTTDSPIWLVEVMEPRQSFSSWPSEYFYFDDKDLADQFFQNRIYSGGVGMIIRPRLATCFDMIQNPGVVNFKRRPDSNQILRWKVVCTNLYHTYPKIFYFDTQEAAYRFSQRRRKFKLDDHVGDPEPITVFDLIRDTK